MDSETIRLLLTGGFGVVGTLAGVGFTQWRSDVRERVRLETEERRDLARAERDAEAANAARLFDHRRAAYVTIVEMYHRWTGIADDIGHGLTPEPAEDAMLPFWQVVVEVDLLGGEDVARTAVSLYWAVNTMVYGLRGAPVPHDPESYGDDQLNAFLEAARKELGVPHRKSATALPDVELIL